MKKYIYFGILTALNNKIKPFLFIRHHLSHLNNIFQTVYKLQCVQYVLLFIVYSLINQCDIWNKKICCFLSDL